MRLDLLGEPRLAIELERSSRCVVGDRFLPLRLPDRVDVAASGLLQLVERLEATVELQLAPVDHSIPLSIQGATLQVELDPGTQVELDVQLEPADSASRLAALVVRLSPALRLTNPAAALRQALLSSDALRPALQALRGAVPPQLAAMLEAMAESTDSAFSVQLTEIALLGKPHTDRLELRLSGTLQLLGQLTIPLQRLAVPSFLLPALSPELETLVSQLRRLAGKAGQFAASPPKGDELPDELLRLLEHATVRVAGRARIPTTTIQTRSVDGIRTTTELTAADLLGISGRVTLRRSADRWRLQPGSGLELSCAEGVAAVGLAGDLPATAPELSSDAGLASEKGVGGETPAPHLALTLTPGSRLPNIDLSFDRTHPLISGEARGALRLSDLEASGATTIEWPGTIGQPGILGGSGNGIRLSVPNPVSARAAIAPSSRIHVQEGERELETAVAGTLSLDATQVATQWQIAAACDAELEHALTAQLAPIPELSLEEGLVKGQASTSLKGTLQLALAREDQFLDVDLTGTQAQVSLSAARLQLDNCELELPADTRFGCTVLAGGIDGAGLRPWDLDLSWDMHGRPCLLRRRERGAARESVVSLLTPVLRRGDLALHLSQSGRLTFSGHSEGLYGERYFNALLDPASDPLEWYEILVSDDAFAHVEATLSLFSPQGAALLADARLLLLAAREIARRERITQPADLIPRARLCRFLSLLLVGEGRLEQQLAPLVRHVTEGHGLPVTAVKALLEQELGDVASGFAIGALLNLLDLLLRPGSAVATATASEESPLALSAAHAQSLRALPSAAEIYRSVEFGAPTPETVDQIATLAPLLTLEQLGYVLQRAHGPCWHEACLDRLRLVHQLKQRIAALTAGYGGIAHATQPLAVALFLGDALRGAASPGLDGPAAELPAVLVPGCALGPEEIATLLRVGLASARQGRRSQLNNRLLLELMQAGPTELTRAVLLELGHRSPRVLSGLLYALLEQDQDKLVEPIDLPALLSQKLGLDVPRQADYLAGGRRARESYYEDLSRLADSISAGADRYLAIKQHLQQVLHPTRGPICLEAPERDLAQRAQAAVEAADATTATHGRRRAGRSERRRACERYGEAFARCAELLRSEPRAFQLDWFRQFWARNEEALRVLSVVRAHQQDLDQVRHWLAVQGGRERFRSEQALLEAVVSALYYDPADQQRLLADPLVRLLLDPPTGVYDFTLVSCMGLITDGERGAELEHAYRRLIERRGIGIVRARTGTGRPLEDNAQRIIEAIETCRTPFGIIGYSQGCANALLAESLLRGGTPEQQRLLDRLVCRNMLFSSANGSAHGSSGMRKFSRAMVAGEHVLKHFQGSYSWEAIRTVLRGLRGALDAPLFLSVLGGAHSITFERARELHRDGQFLDHVPTSCSRTVVSGDRLPEVLEYTYHVLNALTDGSPHDTQVLLSDAPPTAQRVTNDQTRAFARCDIGALPQATHHWAPLTREVKIATTERDRRLAIYESPTDQLVWPWIETNARFGRISRR